MEKNYQNPTTLKSRKDQVPMKPMMNPTIDKGYGISKINILTKNLLKARGSSRIQAPNYTGTERDGIDAAPGDVIFNTTTNKHQGYDGTTWNNLY